MTESRAATTETKTGKFVMSTPTAVQEVKRMSGFLLAREFRGPGDTIEAAAYRMQTRFGIPIGTTMRLRNRDVGDMFLSSVLPIVNAYMAVTRAVERAADRMEGTYAEERAVAADTGLTRLADLVAGTRGAEGQRQTKT
jgi:hypothetical protein